MVADPFFGEPVYRLAAAASTVRRLVGSAFERTSLIALPNTRIPRGRVWFRRRLGGDWVSTPSAESIPTGVCGGARNRVIAQSRGESSTRGENNHDLAHHGQLQFDAAAPRHPLQQSKRVGRTKPS